MTFPINENYNTVMKTNEIARKACGNCKYFSCRYYRANYTYVLALGEGQCGIRKFNEEEQAKLPFGFVCDKWARKNCADADIADIKYELGEITAKLILIVKALSK